jgi:hypothetical protein
MSKEEKAKVGRRDFLRALSVGAGVAAAGTTMATSAAQADSETDAD